ncbi:MAG: BlaI/MecI/CopY family transcriptional regulator [Nitrososphaeria archaeon]|nr:BlaI/MecI/CopY family transcriptional regulator [Aigarchaeota archaeon]MCX8187774.1 BlaI/MecI/CopY family transcriptional regulator [Nitrososphaeria archaeon]MDW8021764.1 BlaI/MecI/CopY family transcriptional regulator [Nitrososphaerota archaeon]
MDIRRGRKRVKFEMVDESGDKVIVIFEGRLNREKLLQMADLMELYGGFPSGEQQEEYYYEDSKLAKLAKVITKYFPFGYFASRDVLEAYMAEYREPISLSTVSTYLTRLSERGYLERGKSGNIVKYRLTRPRVPADGGDITPRIRGYNLDAEL